MHSGNIFFTIFYSVFYTHPLDPHTQLWYILCQFSFNSIDHLTSKFKHNQPFQSPTRCVYTTYCWLIFENCVYLITVIYSINSSIRGSVIQWPIVHEQRSMLKPHSTVDWLQQHKHGISSWKTMHTQYHYQSKPHCHRFNRILLKYFAAVAEAGVASQKDVCVCIVCGKHTHTLASIASTNKSYYLICIFSKAPHQIVTMARWWRGFIQYICTCTVSTVHSFR